MVISVLLMGNVCSNFEKMHVSESGNFGIPFMVVCMYEWMNVCMYVNVMFSKSCVYSYSFTIVCN